MILNMSANVLGLGNAATPFGLKAMQELQKLNPNKAVATDSMALFLAINTAGIAVIPIGTMAVRASLDSANPGGILHPLDSRNPLLDDHRNHRRQVPRAPEGVRLRALRVDFPLGFEGRGA